MCRASPAAHSFAGPGLAVAMVAAIFATMVLYVAVVAVLDVSKVTVLAITRRG